MVQYFHFKKYKPKYMASRKSFSEKYYLHSSVISFVLFLFYMLGVNTSYLNSSILNFSNVSQDAFDGTVYPISFVPNPLNFSYDERQRAFEQFDSKDFIKIPHYDPNIFGKDPKTLTQWSQEYQATMLERMIFTVPYLGNYLFDYKENVWSHPWVDIIAPLNTPVACIANGVVVEIGYQAAGYGNYVLVRHTGIDFGWQDSTFYSLYAHLNKVIVKEWDSILKGKYLWVVGKTGAATAYHLHFQIDTDSAQNHPFWPFSWQDMKQAWVNLIEWINIGLGKSMAISSTVNPFLFIHNFESWVTPSQPIPSPQEEVPVPETPAIQPEVENSGSENPLPPPTEPQSFSWTTTQATSPLVVKREERLHKEAEIVWDDDLVLHDNVEVALLWNPNMLLENRVPQSSTSQTLSGASSLIPVSSWQITPPPLADKPNVEMIDTQEDHSPSLDAGTGSSENSSSGESLTPTPSDASFSGVLYKDIDSTYPYYQALQYLTDAGVIHGYQDSTFRPHSLVSRAETLKMFFKTTKISIVKDRESIFRDIATNSWENAYINTGIEHRMVTKKNAFFHPTYNITRAEIMKFIILLSRKKINISQGTSTLNDVSPSDWYYQYMLIAEKLDLFEIKDGNIFPNQPVTREELLKILYKIRQK